MIIASTFQTKDMIERGKNPAITSIGIEMTKSYRRKEEPMEYLTDMVTTVPEGTSPTKVDELRGSGGSARRSAELKQAI